MREQPSGTWQEAHIAETSSGRVDRDRLLQRGSDPGVVEIDGPDRVRIRIFPMWASSAREIAVTILQTLPHEDEPFRLPLAGVPVTAVDAQVLVIGNGGKKVATFTTPGSPAEDLVLPLRADAGLAPRPVAIGEGGAIARLARTPVGTTTLTSAGPPPPARNLGRLFVAFDTSASREGSITAGIERLRAIAAEAGDTMLDVACFDQDVEPLYHGPARAFGNAHADRIVRRGALGVSNFEKAAAWLERSAQAHKGPSLALVFTDGVHGIGPRTQGDLTPILKRLRAVGVARIGAVVDRPLVQRLEGVTAFEPRFNAQSVLAHLGGPLSEPAEVSVEGSQWYWPRQVTGTAEGGLVFAEAKNPQALAIRVGDQRYAVAALGASKESSPIVSLGIASARLRDLALREERAKDANEAEKIRREIVQRSLESGILTPHTAFVVLENKDEEAQVESGDGRKVVVLASERAGLGRARPAPSKIGRAATSGDRDADGIPDQNDKCPDEFAEDELEYEDADGCPRPENMVQIVNGRPGLLRQPIAFAFRASDPSPTSRPLLVEMAAALRRSPRVGLVEVGGHSRALGSPDESMKVSNARANAVRAFLVAQGVSPDRLIARPYGQTQPRRPHDGDHAMENDRVELAVVMVDGKKRPLAAWPEVLPPPHSGHYAEVEALLADHANAKAIERARDWHVRSADPVAFLALGDALASVGDRSAASRAYGSFIDVFPERPAHWRVAAGYLDRLSVEDPHAASLAIDVYRRAVKARPTFIASQRGLAYALARTGRWEEAFSTALAALNEVTPSREGPLGDEKRGELLSLVRTDASLLGAAWAKAEPAKREPIEQRLVAAGVAIARTPSLHFVVTWENDASNVDLLVSDARGSAASPYTRVLRSGGEYRLDVRTGYGPDWFAIEGKPAAGPYRVAVTYSARGAMGPAFGKVSIVEHDGKGGLTIEDRPFALMNERATLPLGIVGRKRP
jgi:outer membrane protein OmpA-like peptidoglycan-associated protein